MKKLTYAAVILIGIGVIGMLFTFKNANQTTNTTGKKTVAAASLNNLKVVTDVAHVELVSGNTDSFEVTWDGTVETKKQPVVDIVEKGDTLSVTIQSDKKHFKIMSHSKRISSLKVTIALPKRQLKEVTIQSQVGKIDIDHGNMKKLTSTSNVGDISIQHTSTESINVRSDVGAIRVDDSTGMLRAQTNLGKIDIQASEINNDMELETDVGHISLKVSTVPDNVSFDLHSDLGTTKAFGKKGSYQVPNSEYTVRATTDLGSITVK